jgi:leader peptidase (prepilin peptidase)/N-methyltransferase
MTGTAFGSLPTPFLFLFATLLGLTFGSFATVLVARVPTRESLWTRSRCTECSRQILASENIPLFGYLRLKGRCAGCRTRISFLYPLIEVSTALLFIAGIFLFHSGVQVTFWLALVIFGLPLTIIDLTLHRLPDLLTAALFIAAALIIVAQAFITHRYDRLVPSLIGSISLVAFYFALMIISRGGMGMGDVKLSASLGLISGFFGVRAVLVSSFAAYLLGSVIGIALMIGGKAGRKTAIPFGPFMIIGQVISLIVISQTAL